MDISKFIETLKTPMSFNDLLSLNKNVFFIENEHWNEIVRTFNCKQLYPGIMF